MKTYHYLIMSALLLAYGWLYYQKNHSGPDIYDYYRSVSDSGDSWRRLYQKPDTVLGHEETFYALLKDNRIYSPASDLMNNLPVYLRADHAAPEINCPQNEVKITGVVRQADNGDHYFASISSIQSYHKEHGHELHGMLVSCQSVVD